MSLPNFLTDKYRDWKKNSYLLNKELYTHLGTKGQKPKVMIISCCDSRVEPNQIFNGRPGDFFIHRNVANLVPEYSNDYKINNEIISSIEYGVISLKISNIIILGHSNCGGIEYAYNKFYNKNLDNKESYLDNWIQSIKIIFKKINKNLSKKDTLNLLEKRSIVNSITNIKNYPEVKSLLLQNKIKLHGLFFDISSGDLSIYNETSHRFESISH